MEITPVMPQMPYAVKGSSDMSIQEMLACVNYYDKELTADVMKKPSFLARIIPTALDKANRETHAGLADLSREKLLKAYAMGGDLQLRLFSEWGHYKLAQAKAQYRTETAMMVMSIYQQVIVPYSEMRDFLFQRLQEDYFRCERISNMNARRAYERSIQDTTVQIVDLLRRLGEYLAGILDNDIPAPAPLHP